MPLTAAAQQIVEKVLSMDEGQVQRFVAGLTPSVADHLAILIDKYQTDLERGVTT